MSDDARIDESSGGDGDDWLHRLTPEQWMRAAVGEYESVLLAHAQRQHRRAVAGARRAAGMALNALLAQRPDPAFGRTYVEHLRALATHAPAPEPVRAAARALLDASLEAPRLVSLGPGEAGFARAACAILEWAAPQVP